MILDKIINHKIQEVRELHQVLNIKIMAQEVRKLPPVRDFHVALAKRGVVGLIAEVKKCSPSRGLLSKEFDPVKIARIYRDNGAVAISVLTDQAFFGGDINDLSAVRQEVDLPLLRKDFIIDPIQVYQSRLAGADAILLIAAVLSDDKLSELLSLAEEVGLQPLVEIHTLEELGRVLATGAKIIGINNRNLHTFDTDLAVTSRLIGMVDLSHRTVISESGISNWRHMAFLREIGINGALVGEAIISAPDMADKVRELVKGGGANA